MNDISIASVSQDSIHVQSQIDDFFDRFRIGTILNRCGIRKRHGHSVRSLTQAIFTLPFIGKNFFRGMVINPDVPFGKDAAYQLLKGTTYNWSKVLLRLDCMFIVYQCRLASDHRTFGELFYRCCSEVDDISFIEAHYRVLSLAVDQLRNIGSYCEKTASAFLMRSSIPHCKALACKRTFWF